LIARALLILARLRDLVEPPADAGEIENGFDISGMRGDEGLGKFETAMITLRSLTAISLSLVHSSGDEVDRA
jgi:hypothetical protein